MANSFKRRDGFDGEKMISLPPKFLKAAVQKNPHLFQLYITHIGYFPKAYAHYRERRKGCEDNILIYCLQGKGYFIIDQKKFEVTANQYILVPATNKYMRYWSDHEDPWTIYWVHFRGNNLDEFNKSLNLGLLKGSKQIPFNQKALDIWDSIFQSLEKDFCIEDLCNASFCLYHFLASFIFIDKHIDSIEKSNADMISDAIAIMKSKLDQKLSVQEIAERFRLSSSHFSSLFRKSTGMPPIDYFIHLKMQKACHLLNSSDSKVKSIAFTLGYTDQYYFSRLFKKYMGMSPGQYKIISKRGI